MGALAVAPTGGRQAALDSPLYPWDPHSNYLRRPPYWEPSLLRPAKFDSMKALAIRGDDLVARRATLTNNRLRNEMAGGREGSLARLEPEGSIGPLFDVATRYLEPGIETLIVAGRNYGAGSSRDWAAKGVRLLGVRAVVAESFERIHRSNLVGMGILPLEFEESVTRKTLELDVSETYSLVDLGRPLGPGALLGLRILRRRGTVGSVTLRCRIDSEEEARIFAAGGLLPLVRDEIVALTGPRSWNPRSEEGNDGN